MQCHLGCGRVLHLNPSAITSLLEIQPESKVVLNPGEAGSQLLLEEFRISNKQLNCVHPVMQNALDKLQKEQGSSKKICFLPEWSSLKKQLLGSAAFFQGQLHLGAHKMLCLVNASE